MQGDVQVERLGCHLGIGLAEVDAGGVDQDVDPARGLGQRRGGGGVGEVEGVGVGDNTVGCEARLRFGQPVGASGGEVELGPL
jgi:hypothetical protein